MIISKIRQWLKRRHDGKLRKLDCEFMWPAILAICDNEDDAKMTFAVHISNPIETHWNDFDLDELPWNRDDLS